MKPQESSGRLPEAGRRLRALLPRLTLLLTSLLVGLFLTEGLLAVIGSPRRIHEQVPIPPT